MKLTVQRRIAAQVLKCGPSRIRFENGHNTEIKEAITKFDLRSLIKQGFIRKEHIVGNSRGRTRQAHLQRISGRQRGHGSRKGKSGAREGTKRTWMNRIRNQRELMHSLKDNGSISTADFRDLYNKAKGGFFRSRRHVKLYIEEHNLVKKK